MTQQTIDYNNVTEISLPLIIKEIKAGDILLTQNPNKLGTVIKWFQELEGDEAVYTHAALFETDSSLRIYEANTTLQLSDLSDYTGCNICIIRNHNMTQELFRNAYYVVIYPHIGDIYPWHRLALHGFDNGFNWLFRKLGIKWRMKTAKWVSTGLTVCSELVYKVYWYLGFVESWEGTNPDKIHDDAIAHPETWEIIFEGKLNHQLYVCKGKLHD